MLDRNPTAASAADRIGSECLAVRIRLLNRTITGIYDDALRPLGVTAGQLNALVVVTKHGPLSPGDPHFDPFWARVNEAGIAVIVHAGDSGYSCNG